jgi:superfamily II RNA helicase
MSFPEYFKFNYELDTFQNEGCNAIYKNENILITAHTGSGKTALALYAIAKTLNEGKKVIYTSPIKTLSNQKYYEFSQHFDSVGIMTGDIKINPLANLLIMTAEILRNSLLLKKNNNNYEWNFNPNDISCVILDEVHYINNPERGHVWEDIIVNLNPQVQLVMLSATISKASDFSKWVENIKKIKCNLITTYKRPVPLKHGIWWDGEISYFLNGDKEWYNGIWNNVSIKINKYYKDNIYSLNEYFNCIKYLQSQNMIPCITFLLNRALIEKYAKKIPHIFTDAKEQCEIQNIWNNKLRKYKDIYDKTSEWNELYLLATKGIGFHHSGMIPILKEIVEILYSLGLIKVLLATETFAMGVNMPTKTVLFFNITKYDGHNRTLRPEEYGQMAGRAGRRGLDTIGHVIILPFNNFSTETDAKKMILSPPQVITSKFSLDSTYILKNMALYEDLSFNKLVDIYMDTLFHYQFNNSNELIIDSYNKLKDKINDIKQNNNFNEDIAKQIYNIENKLKPDKFIKLDKKLEKRLITEKNNLLKQINIDITKINEYYEYINKVNEIESLLSNNKIELQIKLTLSYLEDLNYINNNKLTIFGKIISEINECNPYILHYLYLEFDKLEFNEIVALCSILITHDKSNTNIYISDLECSNECKQILNNLNNYINKMQVKENELNHNLPYPAWLNWEINYAMFNTINKWALNEFNNDINIGEFIKLVLRLINIIRNIDNIANILNNINLINKLEGFNEKLVRDIVTTDSLYL